MFARNFEDSGPFGRGGHPNFHGLEDKLRGFRAGRGMMEPAIIGALNEKSMHGYEIITYLEEKTHGLWRPSPGSIYPTLQMMEEKGQVASKEQDGKKIYSLTDEGKSDVETSREYLHETFERFANIDQVEGRRINLRHDYQRQFHKQAGEVIKLLRQIFRKGNISQKAAMDNAINDFKARLEQIEKGDF